MILHKLKYSTADVHEQLEKNEKLSRLTHKNILLSEYIYILNKFHGFFSPIESNINEKTTVNEVVSDYHLRRKSSILLNDLSDLVENPVSQTYICHRIPEIQGLHSALGCLYVMEGSTLGGRIIVKNLEKELDLSQDYGASFFHGYGENTGVMWKRFQSFYNQLVLNEEEEKEMISSARDTFRLLNEWFES
jgi:heme oxygenase (biliverdin-IX-beta and delta-forming)